MKIREQLLADITAFMARTGMSERVFSMSVTGDSRFLKRLAAGKGITLTLLERCERLVETGSV